MYHPASFWFTSLDVKPQKVEAVIDMGDEGLFLRQLEIEFVLEKIFDPLLGLFYAFYAVIA